MKKSFAFITLLLSVAVIGIIFIQVSWMKNMLLLREEQIKHRVEEATKQVGEDLVVHRSMHTPPVLKKGILADEFSWDIFNSSTVGSHFDVNEIKQKFNKAFVQNNLKDIPFEFAIATFDKFGNNVFEKMSPNFVSAYEDTAHNYSFLRGLDTQTFSPTQTVGVSEVLFLVVPDIKIIVLQSLRWRIILSLLFTVIIFVAFFLTIRTMLRQKKIGEIKNDFINNMTHEFKTPIATISLAVDAFRNEKVLQERQKMDYFSGIIKEENQRMNRQVETILKASQLEKQEIKLNKSDIHLQEVIKKVVDNFALQLEQIGASVSLHLQATNDGISADEVHIANIINNVIDNAIKYSKEGVPPAITITTSNQKNSIIFKIEDNGIGMSRDVVKKIFEKFYRAHTGNRHDVKGFGLGLSYVKTIVDAHHGKIKVDSTLGKGTVFTIELPTLA